jgi:hypothetical protein
MKMRKIYVCVLGFLSLIACQKDDLNPEVDARLAKLKGKIRLITETDAKGETSNRFFDYDTKPQLVGYQVNDAQSKLLRYEALVFDANGQLSSIKTQNADKSISEKKLVYYSSGKVKQAIETLANGDQNIEEYLFDAQGRISEYTEKQIKGNLRIVLRYMRYTWKNDNVESIIESGINNKYEEEYFEYDTNQANPLSQAYKEVVGLPHILPEKISKNKLLSSMKIFIGNRIKYDYQTNTEGKVTNFRTTQNTEKKPDEWVLQSEIKIEYR